MQEWYHVVFTDESSFCLWGYDRQRQASRLCEKRDNINFVLERHTALIGTRSDNIVCNLLRQQDISSFCFGQLYAASYIASVLKTVIVLYL